MWFWIAVCLLLLLNIQARRVSVHLKHLEVLG